MRAVQVCHSAFFGTEPRLVAKLRPLHASQRSPSLPSPQFTPALWSSQRLFLHHSANPSSAVRFNQPRQASYLWGVALVAGIVGSAAAIQLIGTTSEKPSVPQGDFHQQYNQEHHNFTGIFDTLKMSSADAKTGHLGSLTPEQEAKLREMWTVLSKLFGIKIEGGQLERSATATSNSADAQADGKKKTRRSFFGLGSKKEEAPTTESTANGLHNLSLSDADDKYGQNKEFKQAIADITPEQLRDSLWTMVKADHPDALLLRFLRARKWDVNRAVVMLISTIRWRLVEMHVDDDIMAGGEAKAVEMSKSSDSDKKRLGGDFIAQMRMGKSFIHGVDDTGRPMCFIRVRLHKIGQHVGESTERFTVHMIETARLMLLPPVETAVIVFDMTGFTLANMDYSPVKFIIKCFEANYPESLGAVLIHQAPWIFFGIWKVIKGWLDPVVAAKVHFTNTVEDLEAFIDRSRILKELGGNSDYNFEYIEPQPGENDLMKDTAKRDEIIAKNKAIAEELQNATKDWIEAANKDDQEGVKSAKAKREELASKYAQGYWELDPYVRARSLYDRNGIIQGGGKIQFYPPKEAKDEAKPEAKEETNKDAESSGSSESIPTAAEEKIGAAIAPEINGVDTTVAAN